ncbi:MAG TPA: hypothetical protein VH593_16100, partial [Ktedonobacteraceae bacterium]
MMRDQGAHFYRCDFQVHTPRDAQWQGARPTSDAERHRYATDFIAACRKQGLEAVAITDHHDLAMLPLIRSAAQTETTPTGKTVSEEEQLVVFPGVELTLGIPCQAVLILDANFPDDLLSDVLKILNIEEVDHTEHKLPVVTCLHHINDFHDLCEILDQRAWLKGR